MDEIGTLYQVADDSEAQILDTLRDRAGITWTHYGCWTNPGSSTTCEECGQSRTALQAAGLASTSV